MYIRSERYESYYQVAVIVLVIIGIFGVYRATKVRKNYYAAQILIQIEFVLNDKYEVNKVIALNEDKYNSSWIKFNRFIIRRCC